MDQDTRDYFFALFKSSTPASKEYILTSMYGYLEGCYFGGDREGLEFLMRQIQNHTDVDHGVKR
jgi:hypothetical protein